MEKRRRSPCIVERVRVLPYVPTGVFVRCTGSHRTVPAAEPDGWEFVKGTSLNALVIGSTTATKQWLNELRPYLSAPIVDVRLRNRLTLSSLPHGGTVILRDIDRLPLTGQHRLYRWLDGVDRRTRVISTSPIPLGQLVIAETFFDSLYYRLNMLYITLTSPSVSF
jgi:transcriptional regulator of acetoin/glycerol metabolism